MHAHQGRLTDHPGVQKLLRLHDRWIVKKILGNTERHAGLRRGGDDAVRFGHRGAHGFLARNVFASLQRGKDLVDVQKGRGQQFNRING